MAHKLGSAEAEALRQRRLHVPGINKVDNSARGPSGSSSSSLQQSEARVSRNRSASGHERTSPQLGRWSASCQQRASDGVSLVVGKSIQVVFITRRASASEGLAFSNFGRSGKSVL